MALKTWAEWEFVCLPKSGVARRVSPAFVRADLFGDRMNLGQGDGLGTAPQGYAAGNTSGSASGQWNSAIQGEFGARQNVEFVRFLPNGLVEEGASNGNNHELSGYIIQARDAWLDAKIGSNATQLDGGNFDQSWESLLGTWKTVVPPDEPRRTWIANTGSDLKAQARTVGVLPANRSLRFDLYLLLHKPGQGLPEARLMWGDEAWSVVLSHGMKPTLEKKVDGEWSIVRRLEQVAPIRFNGGRYTIRVRRIAGRLVIDFNETTIHHLETTTGDGNEPRAVDVSWPSGKLGFNVFNCKARLSVALIKYSQPDGTSFVGSFVRLLGVLPFGQELGQLQGHARGWNRDGTTVLVVPTTTPQLQYTTTLSASPDGIDSPFVSGCILQSAPQWLTHAPAPLDITPAVKRGSVSMPVPGLLPSAQLRMELDRNKLQRLSTRWQSYVGEFTPVTARVRWHYENGSVDPWCYLFQGYVLTPDAETTAPHARNLNIVAGDNIIRLQKPAAVIDGRFSAPLDFLLQVLAAGGRTSLFGYDCVQHIIDTCIGREVLGDLVTVFPPSHNPLLSLDTDLSGGWMFVSQILSSLGTGQPPTSAKWHFPPPYEKDALGWINQFEELDSALFAILHENGDPTEGWAKPVYGRLPSIIALRPTHRFADRIYLSDDINHLLMNTRVETRPESNINRILVTGSPPQGDLAAFMPALPQTVAEARLPTSDPNSAERTWERTLWVRSDLANLSRPGTISDYIARRFIDDIQGVKMLFPSSTVRGEPTMCFGNKVEYEVTQSGCAGDDALRINGQTFVAENIVHVFDFDKGDGQDFITEFGCFPRPNSAL